jgi:hypothetical protein
MRLLIVETTSASRDSLKKVCKRNAMPSIWRRMGTPRSPSAKARRTI